MTAQQGNGLEVLLYVNIFLLFGLILRHFFKRISAFIPYTVLLLVVGFGMGLGARSMEAEDSAAVAAALGVASAQCSEARPGSLPRSGRRPTARAIPHRRHTPTSPPTPRSRRTKASSRPPAGACRKLSVVLMVALIYPSPQPPPAAGTRSGVHVSVITRQVR